MPRPLRFSPAGSVLHAVNRGNDKKILFESVRNFEEFLWLVVWAKQQCPIRIIAYCIMRNHWHFVVWPSDDDQVATFFHLLSTTHAVRRRRDTCTIGHGHIYQDRYRAHMIWTEVHYWNVLRYVESNPLRANLVRTSAKWRWSSLYERLSQPRGILDDGPFALPDNWSTLVDMSIPDPEIAEIRKALRKH